MEKECKEGRMWREDVKDGVGSGGEVERDEDSEGMNR